MANDFNSVLATCQRFQDIATWDAEHFNANDALARIAELHKHELAAKDEEIAKRDAIIKELADALNYELEIGCIRCLTAHQSNKCPHSACDRIGNRALVAKAREVVSKTETTTEGRQMTEKEKRLMAGCDGSCLDHRSDPHYCKENCEIRILWEKAREVSND